MTERGGAIIFCRILAPPNVPPPPSPDVTILNNLNDRERGRHYFLSHFGVPQCPPPPLSTTPQYLTILMTVRGGAIIFCRILAPPNAPPSSDVTILNNLNDRERGRHYILSHFGAPQCPPPLSTTPQYLTILMTVRRGAIIFCRILAPPNAPPPSPQTSQYLTILMTEKGGRIIFCRILVNPNAPPSPDVTILNYLNDRERRRHYFL